MEEKPLPHIEIESHHLSVFHWRSSRFFHNPSNIQTVFLTVPLCLKEWNRSINLQGQRQWEDMRANEKLSKKKKIENSIQYSRAEKVARNAWNRKYCARESAEGWVLRVIESCRKRERGTSLSSCTLRYPVPCTQLENYAARFLAYSTEKLPKMTSGRETLEWWEGEECWYEARGIRLKSSSCMVFIQRSPARFFCLVLTF